MRKFYLFLVMLFVFVWYQAIAYFGQPTPYLYKSVEIPAKTSLTKISKILEREGILRHRWTLIALAKATGLSHKVKSGEFRFLQPSSPINVLRTLRGQVVLHRVTVPEGSTIAEMAKAFEVAEVISAREFLYSSRDPMILRIFQIPGDRIEGYLFPSTYLFPKRESVETIFRVMYTELEKNMKPEDQQKAIAYGWNTHQWITFASVIEKETSRMNEYGLVSSVFHNRLKKGMRLQSDPTVIYGIENYDGNIRKKDLVADTPYNTYTRAGLPIGPVSSPGAAAIHAAVNPSKSDFLYFVANKTGEHVFTKTYEEHLAAVAKYQLRRK